MRILIIVDDYMPHSIKIAAKMMHQLACEFVSQGDSVSVLTPDSTIEKDFEKSELDGVNIYRFKSGTIKNTSQVKRAINETLLSYRAWKHGKEFFKNNKHELIIYYSPTIFFGALVYKLKKIWDAKSYLVLRDFFPQWTIDNKILHKNSPITYYFKFFEKLNYLSADTIGVMSEKNLEWFKEYYKTEKKIEVLYNWTDMPERKKSKNIYRKKLALEEKIVFFYGGNMGQAQDMLNIVRLAKNMQNEVDAHFLLVGTGDEVLLVKEAIEKQNLTNITLLPSVNQEEFLQMLDEFDIGLFTLNQNHTTHNFPGKLLGYMSHDLAILGSVNKNNDLKNIIDEYSAGAISINPDDESFYINGKKLLDSTYRKTLCINAKKLLNEKFLTKSALKQILKSVE